MPVLPFIIWALLTGGFITWGVIANNQKEETPVAQVEVKPEDGPARREGAVEQRTREAEAREEEAKNQAAGDRAERDVFSQQLDGLNVLLGNERADNARLLREAKDFDEWKKEAQAIIDRMSDKLYAEIQYWHQRALRTNEKLLIAQKGLRALEVLKK